MLIEEIKDNNDLTYKIFINKSIKLLEKIYIIIEQYNKIRSNNEMLTNEIKNIINFSKNIDKIKDLNNNPEFDIGDNEDLMKNLMNKLYKLNTFLNNYIETFRNDVYNTHLNIQIIYKELKYDISEIIMYYEKDYKEFNILFSSCKNITINNNTDDIFEHINNISNNYKLTTKIILYINSIIFLGEISKKQNTNLKNIYKLQNT